MKAAIPLPSIRIIVYCVAWSIALALVFYSPVVFAQDNTDSKVTLRINGQTLDERFSEGAIAISLQGSTQFLIDNGEISITEVNVDGTFNKDAVSTITIITKNDSTYRIDIDGIKPEKDGRANPEYATVFLGGIRDSEGDEYSKTTILEMKAPKHLPRYLARRSSRAFISTTTTLAMRGLKRSRRCSRSQN